MPLFPVGDNNPIDIYPIIPSLDGTELIEIANKGTTKLYSSTGMISDFTIVNLTQTGYLDLAEIAAPASPSVNIARLYALDTNGVTGLAYKDNAGRINFITGAVPVNVKDYGAVGNGVADDTVALNLAGAAAKAANRPLYFPAGTYLTSTGVSIWTGAYIYGDGLAVSIVKLKNSSNTHVFYGETTAAKFGGSSATGDDEWLMRGLTIDGNKTNNTDGSGIKIYGQRYMIEDVAIQNCADDGITSDFSDSSNLIGMEAHLTGVTVSNSGQHGIRWTGPHDSVWVGVVSISASQDTNNGFSGFYIGEGNVKMTACHAWSFSTSTNRMFAAIHLDTGSSATTCLNCDFEGAQTANVYVNCQNNVFTGCRYYSAWNGVNIIVRQNLNRIEGWLGDPAAGRPACKGVVLGLGSDNAELCHINITGVAQEAGFVDFTNEVGSNTVIVRGFNTGSTNLVGTPAATDTCLIDIKSASTISTVQFPKTISADALSVGKGAGSVATNTVVGAGALAANTTGANNTAIGKSALALNTTGAQQVAVGASALAVNTTGAFNTAVGYSALAANTTGQNNVAVGVNALLVNTSGGSNAAIGANALTANTTGVFNTAVGASALAANIVGTDNVAVGTNALAVSTTSNNVAIGSSALAVNTTGTGNTAIGKNALAANTTGASNTATGSSALAANTTGASNVAIGASALAINTTGANNTAVGVSALAANLVGTDNVSVGTNSLLVSTASNNVAIGSSALAANTTGTSNIAIGKSALAANTTGASNVAVGASALLVNTTGAQQVAIGALALTANTTGAFNTAVGSSALAANTTGQNNVAIGVNALLVSTTGSSNMAIGSNALAANTVASFNIAIGASALTGNTTGASNVGIGTSALSANTTGANNTAVGDSAGNNITTATNCTCLGNGATNSAATTANIFTLGNASVATLRCQQTTITALSDMRDKKDVEELEIGLDFLCSEHVRPVEFTWNMRDGAVVGVPDIGFIAQELQAAQDEFGLAERLKLIHDANPDRIEATPGRLLPIMVRAIQELAARVKELEAMLVP